MRLSTRGFLCAGAGLASCIAGSPALAQPAAANQVEELIVTAQKRSESLQDVPAAISAVSGADLEERGVVSPSDLQFIVPSMQAGRLLGQTSITIRGVGLNQGSPGVAIHVDGVYQPRPSMGDLTQVDIARVEVLRGPQGTLYGRNANGGVINYLTKAPSGEFEGYVQGGYASYQESHLQGVLNVPIHDRLRVRLVADRRDRSEGFVKNVIPGGKDVDKGEVLSARLKIAADITENLSLDLAATGLTASGPSA